MSKKRWMSWILFLLVFIVACGGGEVVEEIPTSVPATNTAQPVQEVAKETATSTGSVQAVPPTPLPETNEEPEEPEEPVEPEVVIPGPAELQAATVQIYAKIEDRGQLRTNWTGSGTIISADGLILTNAHVASPLSPGLAALYNDLNFVFGEGPDQLVIGIVESADLPPVETYVAEVRAADGVLDLAVLQIVETMDGTPIDATTLALPFVALGDSDLLNLGDEIQVYGFPGAGGETITFTRGEVSGFEIEDVVGKRAWIKTATAVSPGNSGGLGANVDGKIIGVPSFVREAQGGSINRLRSINLALPMIAAAETGENYQSPYVVSGTGSESFEFVTWAEDFDEDTSCAIASLSNYDSGALATVAIFRYKGMTDGEQLIIAWFYNDELLLSDIRLWDGGKSGDCFAVYVHNYGDPLGDGEYEVELYAGGDAEFVGGNGTTVGGTAVSSPTADASTGVQIDGTVTDADSGQPVEGAFVVILNPGSDLDAWIDEPVDAELFDIVETNGKGAFELTRLLERGVEYPAFVGKSGYFPNKGFLLFDESDSDVVTLALDLSK